MSRADGVIRQCREVVDWLRANGEMKRANDVQTLIITLTNSRNAMSQLWTDNAELRRQIEGESA